MTIEDDILNAIRQNNDTQLIELLNSITSLDLHFKQIVDQKAEKIASILSQNKTLTSLNLSWNIIGEEGAEKIAEMLNSNKTLTSFYFHFNQLYNTQLDKEMENAINNLIKQNCILRDNCVTALKQNNLEHAQQLLQQGVSPNGVLLKLIEDKDTQLESFQHLFQLAQNNALLIFKGAILKAIETAKTKKHFIIVNYLRQFLQMLPYHSQTIQTEQKIAAEKKYLSQEQKMQKQFAHLQLQPMEQNQPSQQQPQTSSSPYPKLKHCRIS